MRQKTNWAAVLGNQCDVQPPTPSFIGQGISSRDRSQAGEDNGGNTGGESHLVVMGQDGCDLAAGEGDILARKLIDSPGPGIEGVVECKVPTQAPVPAAQDARALHGQDLLVHSLPFPTQAHCELTRKEDRLGWGNPRAPQTRLPPLKVAPPPPPEPAMLSYHSNSLPHPWPGSVSRYQLLPLSPSISQASSPFSLQWSYCPNPNPNRRCFYPLPLPI